MNSVVLTGRLAATPELKQTTGGKDVTSFGIAVNRRFQQNGERKADFIDCVAWNATAVFISRYFKKGDGIAVVGEIQTRNFEDKNGNKRKAVEIIISQAEFYGGTKQETDTKETPETFAEIAADDFPF